MIVYHHTKFENFEKIILQEGLSFRGSFYKEFSNTDYKWTKRVVSHIIKRICLNRKSQYDEDSSFSPIVISFGKEPNSSYMWEKYAEQYAGVQFVLDSNIIQRYALDKLDYFSTCCYMRKRGRMKRFIEQVSYDVVCVNDVQTNLEAVSVLIKPIRFGKEQEIRYTHTYSRLFRITYEDFKNKGDEAFEECVPEVNDDERFVCFPKKALIGIRIGYKNSTRFDEVKNLLIERGYVLSKVSVDIYTPK